MQVNTAKTQDSESNMGQEATGKVVFKKNVLISCLKSITPSIATVVLTIIFVFGLLLNGDHKPLVKRGFFCNDSTISYPIKLDTVDFKTLILIGCIIPLIVILICDRRLRKLLKKIVDNSSSSFTSKKRRKQSDHEVGAEEVELMPGSSHPNDDKLTDSAGKPESIKMKTFKTTIDGSGDDLNIFTRELDSDNEGNCYKRKRLLKQRCHEILKRKYSESQLFFFGIDTTLLMTGIGKVTVGRLRPHFLKRCSPNIDCLSPGNLNRYIEDFECTNQLKGREYSYITTSWPSGHASIMFFSMLYLVIFLDTVIPTIVHLSSPKVRKFEPFILYVIYVSMISLAGYVALTRISDYHHHPLDVLSGSVIGSIIAISLANSVTKQYYKKILQCFD